MNSDNNQEMFPLVDEQGNIIGAATRGECHNGSKLLHPVIHLHVFNSKGELYLQKRPPSNSSLGCISPSYTVLCTNTSSFSRADSKT